MNSDQFTLVRLAGQLLDPFYGVHVLLAAGLLAQLLRRRLRAGLPFYGAALLWLGALGWEPSARLAYQTIENRYPPLVHMPPGVQGMVVLGGGAEADLVVHDAPDVFSDYSIERLSHSLALARQHPRWTVVFTGEYGKASTLPIERTEARSALNYWKSKGLPANRIELEEKSHNTAENAHYTAQLLGERRSKPWVLVTSAWHMPRAMAAFEMAGVNVLAYPVDFRMRQPVNWRNYSLAKGRHMWKMTLSEHVARWALWLQMP